MKPLRDKYLMMFAVVAPILVLLAWTLQLTLIGSSGRELHLKVRGLDPRDLLAGHYWTYQLDLPEGVCRNQPMNAEVCACFEHGENAAALSIYTGATICRQATNNCQLALRGQCKDGFFDTGMNRFYIDERIAKKVPNLPANSTLRIGVDDQGRGVARELLIEGKTISEYVESLPPK